MAVLTLFGGPLVRALPARGAPARRHLRGVRPEVEPGGGARGGALHPCAIRSLLRSRNLVVRTHLRHMDSRQDCSGKNPRHLGLRTLGSIPPSLWRLRMFRKSLRHPCHRQTTEFYILSLCPLLIAAPVVLVGLIDVRRGDAVLMPALRAFPNVFMVVETILNIQVCAATVAIPINIWESLAHFLTFPFECLTFRSAVWPSTSACVALVPTVDAHRLPILLGDECCQVLTPANWACVEHRIS